MSVDEQIEAAWEEYVNDMDEDVRRTVAFHSDIFAAGYRAALRDLFKDVEPSEMIVGRSYWSGGRVVEVQGLLPVTGSDGTIRLWPIINGTEVCPALFVFRGPIPNRSDFPAEVFGEDVGK